MLTFKARYILLALLFIFSFSSSSSYADGITKNVKFKKGMYSATYKGAVIRGDTDAYVLKAKSGQVMEVKITSTESNAVFKIVDKKTKKTLPSAGSTDDATTWKGELPSTGTYKIVVSGTRGNAEYEITIAIL